ISRRFSPRGARVPVTLGCRYKIGCSGSDERGHRFSSSIMRASTEGNGERAAAKMPWIPSLLSAVPLTTRPRKGPVSRFIWKRLERWQGKRHCPSRQRWSRSRVKTGRMAFVGWPGTWQRQFFIGRRNCSLPGTPCAKLLSSLGCPGLRRAASAAAEGLLGPEQADEGEEAE